MAKLHEVKMQAEICEDHSVPDQNEEAHIATKVSILLGIFFQWELEVCIFKHA